MAQQKVPDNPTLYTTYYQNLKGIDLASSVIECSRNRAADLLNITPNNSDGIPVKRTGWRNIRDFEEAIIGAYHDEYDSFDLIATSNHLYYFKNGTYTAIVTTEGAYSNVNMFHFDGKVYVIGYGRYFTVDSSGGSPVITDIGGYVPTTIISKQPDGTGGQNYEGVNILSNQRIVSFWDHSVAVGQQSARGQYIFYPADIALDHNVTAINKVETMQQDGTWYTLAASEYAAVGSTGHYNGVNITGHKAYNAVEGQDNVRVTFTEIPSDNTLRDKLLNANIATLFGAVNTDRAFVVLGRNRIYYSEAEKLNFFPDDNYVEAGNDAPIIGLHKKNGSLVAVTGSSSEHSIFLISPNQYTQTRTVIGADGETSVEEELITYYTVKSSIVGTGAVASKSFRSLIDDPLFLGSTGIYGITANALTSELLISNRSTLINARLTEEPALDDAVATVYHGLYILAVGEHCYVLDSKNTVRDRSGNTCYEAYYWDLGTMNITTFLSYNGNLFFGTSDGKWRKFNTDIDNSTAYSDDGTLESIEYYNELKTKYSDDQDILDYIDECIAEYDVNSKRIIGENVVRAEDGSLAGFVGEAIKCRYALRLDDDDRPQYYKTMNKKGCVVTAKPYDKSSITVSFSKNGGELITLGTHYIRIKRWTEIDFTAFNFLSTLEPQDAYTRKKIKKYKRLQLIFSNDEVNEPFGLVQFTKTYSIGNFAKG